MAPDYIFLSLYLGFFAPNNQGYKYDHHQSHLLSSIRFLLSRVLMSDSFNILKCTESAEASFAGDISEGFPYIAIDDDADTNADIYSFHENNCDLVLDARELIEKMLDEDLIQEHIGLIDSFDSGKRDSILWKLREPYMAGVSFSIGFASISPIDPYIALLERIRSGAIHGRLSDKLHAHEVLALLASVVLFRSISGCSRIAYDSSDAYFATMTAYSKLALSPKEFALTQKNQKKAEQLKKATEAGRNASRKKRVDDGIENRKALINAAVDVRLAGNTISVEKIVEKLVAKFLLHHRDILTFDISKPCLGLYSSTSAVRNLSGFSGCYKKACDELNGDADIVKLKDKVIELMVN